jgi:hypothetical protein
MKTRIIGGWALVINAVVSLLFLVMYQTAGGDVSVAFLLLGEALSLLLIVGVFVLWPELEHTGWVGQIGLWCLALATIMAFLVRLALLLGVNDAGVLGDIAPLASAVLGCVGGVLVGWATIQTKTFHPIMGWLLIVGGVLNLLGGLFDSGAVVTLLGIISALANVGAFAGYGWTLLRQGANARHATLEQA